MKRKEVRRYAMGRGARDTSCRRAVLALAVVLPILTANSAARAQTQRIEPPLPAESTVPPPVGPGTPIAPAGPTPAPQPPTEPTVPTATPTPAGLTETTSTPAANAPATTPAPAEPSPAPPPATKPQVAESLPQVLPMATTAKTGGELLPYGIGLDLGVSGILPDTGLLLTWRPRRWIHAQLGGGFNVISFAIRGGVTLISPRWVPLSLTAEAGHYFDGDANKSVRWFSGQNEDIASLKKVGYDYLNALVGLTTSGRRFSFYFRVGVTWMRTTVNDFQQTVNQAANLGLEASDPKVTYLGPTIKFGMIVFL
jgi:hypothetical protein